MEKALPKSFPTSQSREKPEGRLSYPCQFYEECPDADPAEPKCAYNPALSEYCPRYLELTVKKTESSDLK
ncbi:hypothetical protein MUP77_23030 [Candidatus Bathyarchaeota archaeon]|nr:hypothetical protein [Candidatus Bathyarchaeota archaeon]